MKGEEEEVKRGMEEMEDKDEDFFLEWATQLKAEQYPTQLNASNA